ncbi:MaoC: dehydratase, MaoC family [Desulfosarcina variabilis str. Montpellier]|uniref:MaoC family dehydratase n=1 Tax=Desulfosarcina variabilis TaxID=2300 RepID=UPI003AFAB8D5
MNPSSQDGCSTPVKKELPLSQLMDLAGTCIGKSDWLTIDQARIEQFASATNDQQWIHVDPARAEKGPYGGPIAHGLLTLSMIPYFSSQVSYAPAGTLMVVNYGFNRVRMISPVPVGASIRDVMVLQRVEARRQNQILTTTRHTIEIQGADKPACVADLLALHVTGS